MADERAASNTAIGVAQLRAAHQLIDDPPRILNDTVVVRLLGPDTERRAREMADQLQRPLARGLRSHVVLRSRFAEDCLARAVERGARQYMLLGAGLDTFAYRQPDWAQAITIIEVDQPASQAVKRRLLGDAGIAIPGNVRFVSVDFERESLAESLARHRVDTSALTFFSWLGVTMYLERDAIDAVLRTVASFPRGSEIVLTYAQPKEADDPATRIAEQAAAVGEPWVSFFTPAEMESVLRHHGFAAVEHLTRDEATRRYYTGRTDDLVAPRRVSICRGVVG